MIILEGPDGAGKTTLANALARSLDLPIADKVVNSQTEALVDLRAWVEENVNAGFQATIFDRHRLISGPIYNAVKRRSSEGFSDLTWMNFMTRLFYRANPMVIYCLPKFSTVMTNVMAGVEDNSAVAQEIGEIYDLYVSSAARDIERGVGLRYDYQVDDIDQVITLVKAHLEGHRFITVPEPRKSWDDQATDEAKFDYLNAIFEGQRVLMGRYHEIEEANGAPVISPMLEGHLDDRQVQMRLKDLAYRMVEEIAEATGELKNKPWKQENRPTNVPAFLEEVSDIFHFFVEFCITAGIDHEGLHTLYFAKQQKNQARQNSGY